MQLPNSESPRGDSAPASFRDTDAPHVAFWNPKCLSDLLKKIGYKIIDIDSFGPSEEEYVEKASRKQTWSVKRHPDGRGRKLRVVAQKELDS
jgi:hypothetical protein